MPGIFNVHSFLITSPNQTLLLSCNSMDILDQLVEGMSTGQLAGFPSQVWLPFFSVCVFAVVEWALTSRHPLQIRDAVLTFLFKSGRHLSLMKSEHFRPLMKLLVLKAQSDQVEEMVNYLNNNNRRVSPKCHAIHSDCTLFKMSFNPDLLNSKRIQKQSFTLGTFHRNF